MRCVRPAAEGRRFWCSDSPSLRPVSPSPLTAARPTVLLIFTICCVIAVAGYEPQGASLGRDEADGGKAPATGHLGLARERNAVHGHDHRDRHRSEQGIQDLMSSWIAGAGRHDVYPQRNAADQRPGVQEDRGQPGATGIPYKCNLPHCRVAAPCCFSDTLLASNMSSQSIT